MKLPDYPVPGESIPASWGRQVVDILRSLMPKASPEVLPTWSPNGTTWSLLRGRNPAPVDLRPKHVFVAGRLLTIPTGAKYIAVYFDGRVSDIGEGTYAQGMESGFPDDCEYYDLSRTFGDIHVHRA